QDKNCSVAVLVRKFRNECRAGYAKGGGREVRGEQPMTRPGRLNAHVTPNSELWSAAWSELSAGTSRQLLLDVVLAFARMTGVARPIDAKTTEKLSVVETSRVFPR